MCWFVIIIKMSFRMSWSVRNLCGIETYNQNFNYRENIGHLFKIQYYHFWDHSVNSQVHLKDVMYFPLLIWYLLMMKQKPICQATSTGSFQNHFLLVITIYFRLQRNQQINHWEKIENIFRCNCLWTYGAGPLGKNIFRQLYFFLKHAVRWIMWDNISYS